MGEALWFGMLLGVGAAISVGPIFVTIIQEAATRGFGSSFRVIIGSAVADIVLLLPSLAFSWLIAGVAAASFWVGLIGVAFFAYLGIGSIRDAHALWHRREAFPAPAGWSFWKGLFGNLSNPLSWSFWLAVGTPAMLHSYRGGGWRGLVVFTVTWFVVASGLEAAIAGAVASSRQLIGTRGQALLSSVAALVFFVLALSLLRLSVL